MTREDVIRMAQDAGLGKLLPEYDGLPATWIGIDDEKLERFAALVAAAEREACAKVCEGMHEEDRPGDYSYAIRSRGKS